MKYELVVLFLTAERGEGSLFQAACVCTAEGPSGAQGARQFLEGVKTYSQGGPRAYNLTLHFLALFLQILLLSFQYFVSHYTK